MNHRGPRDLNEGPTEVDSPPQATLGRPSHRLAFGAGMDSPLLLSRQPKILVERCPAKGNTVSGIRTPFAVSESSRGRRRTSDARLDHLPITPRTLTSLHCFGEKRLFYESVTPDSDGSSVSISLRWPCRRIV